MTERDWILLDRAHRTKAVDNQLVRAMVDEAESEECKELLTIQYHYLYAKEQELAGYL